MKDFKINIGLIDDYLTDKLSGEELSKFKDRIKNDSEFEHLFQDHQMLIGGIERSGLKMEILKAQQSYFNIRWLKTIGVSISSIGLLICLYLIANKSTNHDPFNNDDTETETVFVIKDSMTDIDGGDLDESDTISIKIPLKRHLGDTILADKKSNNLSVNQFEIIKKPQVFRIDVSRDTIIKANEGTRIMIPANSFEHSSTGVPIQGTIDFEITEFYKLSDIILANLSTTSDGDIIETGGMVNLKASKDGEALNLSEGSALQIHFQGQSRLSNMKPFKGQWKDNSINWILDEQGVVTLKDTITTRPQEENIEVPFAVVEEVPVFPGCENLLESEKKNCTQEKIKEFIYENINWAFLNELDSGDTQTVMVVFRINRDGNVESVRGRLARSGSSIPFLVEEVEEVVKLLPTMTPGKQRGREVTVPYSLPIIFEANNKNISVGSISSQNYQVDSTYTYIRSIPEEIREILHDPNVHVDSALIKKWESYKENKLIRIYGLNSERQVILRKPLFELDNTVFVKLPGDSVTRGGHIIRTPWDSTKIPTTTRILTLKPKRRVSIGRERVSREEFENRLNEIGNSTINSKDVSNYAFSLTELGWVNCDRFIRWAQPLIKVRAETSGGGRAQVSMVFKSVKAVLEGSYLGSSYIFEQVPKGEEVLVVAIKRQNGKLFFDKVNGITEIGTIFQLKMKELTLAELKEQLIMLDR